MSRPVAYAIALAAALVAGWIVPALSMRALAPSLEASPLSAENYRGRRLFLGLGLVWPIWAVSLFVTSAIFEVVAAFSDVTYGSTQMLLFDAFTMPLYAVPVILTLATALFGMADDVFGTRGDKGFKGHLSALLKGRLTTGGLKLLGIGAVAAVHAWRAGPSQSVADGTSLWTLVLWWVAATLVIALSANLLNLLDLRPGRALKSYALLSTVAGITFVLQNASRYAELASQAGAAWGGLDTAILAVTLLVVLLGPAAAVWRFDLGELGMLGDAGSNVMGAIVGYLLARSLPLPWLVGAAVVLLGLNLLSERVSFSAVIERSAALRYLDGLGRLPEGEASTEREGR